MTSITTRLRRDRSGSIAVIFALTIFLIVLVIGLAVDGARAYGVSARVSSALDAAALAAAKMLDDDSYTDGDIQDRASRFFQAQLQSVGVTGLTMPPVATRIDRANGEVEVSVDVTLATTFGQLAGLDAFRFPRSSKVVYDMKRIELAMVLDITGSMCFPCDKMQSLKTAAIDVVRAMLTPATPAGFVRIGLVPYGAAVNAGGFANPASFGASTDGCVVERTGAAAYTDAPPGAMAPSGTATTATNPQYSCPPSPILPLSHDRATLEAAINAMSPNGATAGHIGLGWGWYMVSNAWSSFWPYASRPRAPDPKVIKAVLLMTDGMFNTSYIPGPGLNAVDAAVVDGPGYQAQQLCDAMRGQNVVVYSVAFQAPPSAEALLRSCATSNAHFYVADNAADLRAAFQDIAAKLTALRIGQ